MQVEASSKHVARNNKAPEKAPVNQPRVRLWTPLFVLVIGMTLCCFMVGQGINAGTSVYLSHIGEGTTLAGALAGVFSIAAAATRIICGPLVDRKGRYPVMVAGMALLVAGTLAPAFVTDATALALCRVVQGVGFSAATTASATAAADVLPLSRLGEGIGYYGLGQALAMSVGPALALFLVGTDPAANLFFGLTAVATLGLILTLFCRYERNPAKLPATSTYRKMHEEVQPFDNSNHSAKDIPVRSVASLTRGQKRASSSRSIVRPRISSLLEPHALPGALPMMVISPAFGFGIFFVGLYGTSLDVGNPGLFYTLSAVSMILVRLKSSSFMDRAAPLKVFGAAVICGIAAYVLLLLSTTNEVPYYAAGLLYGVCLGIASPLNQSIAVKNSPKEHWGAASALFLLATDIGIGLSSVVWGLINDAFGFTTTIIGVIGCIFASFVVAWFVYPRGTSSAPSSTPTSPTS